MKLRMIDRILAAVVGLLLVALAVVPLVDSLFNLGLWECVVHFVSVKSTRHLIALAGCCCGLLLVGILCLHLAIRRPRRQGFVMQATEAGELSISIRAIEDLVNKCVEKHEELHVTSTSLENTRNGLVISLRVSLATGVNIPLAVSALQKQIRQYVTACSGVDVYEVKVQVDTTSTKVKASIYAVPDMLETAAPLALEQPAQPEAPAPQPEKEPEEKCLHQRLFGEEEQPAIVPAPPAEEPEKPEEDAPCDEAVEDNVPSDEAIEAWDANVPSDEAELESLAGLTDEPDEAAIEDLKALDGADEADLTEE